MTLRRSFFRSSSLYWTFAASFLLVLILAIVLQGLVVLFVIEPVARRLAEERARRAAAEAAAAIASRWDDLDESGIREALQAAKGDSDRFWLLYQGERFGVVSERALPRHFRRGLSGFFRTRRDSVVPPAELPPPPGGPGLPPRWDGPEGSGPPRRWDGPEGSGPREDRPGELDRRGGPSRGRGPGFPRDETRERRGPRVLGQYPVQVAQARVGEVVAIGPPVRFLDWPFDTPRPVILFLPVALILAGGAGMIMFRLVVGRLRKLEDLATRVAQGDLEARILDPGPDEIGRLGLQLNRMTETLAAALADLERSDRQRRQLLADVSHELATPLTSVRGYAETLLNEEVQLSAQERTEYLRDVLAAANRLDLLIKDLFDLTRLEAGAVRMEPESLDWSALCRNTVERYQARFRDAGLDLQWESGGSAWVHADGRRLEQVLENLLVNELRYAAGTGSWVRVAVTAGATVSATTSGAGARDSRTMHRLDVEDDGPGFPEASLDHVFERFYRVDAARAEGGTGLGLAIVREIVRRHDGRVFATNRRPGGARLSVELPAVEPGV